MLIHTDCSNDELVSASKCNIVEKQMPSTCDQSVQTEDFDEDTSKQQGENLPQPTQNETDV